MEPYLPNYLKGKNRRLVFDLLRERGQMSRAEITRDTGMSFPTAMKVVDAFLEKGLLVELDETGPAAGAGRKGRLLRFEPGAYRAVGVECEGRFARVGLADMAGGVQARETIELGDFARTRDLSPLAAAIRRMCAAANGAPVLGVCIGFPANLDPDAVPSSATRPWTSSSPPPLRRYSPRSGGKWSCPSIWKTMRTSPARARHSCGAARAERPICFICPSARAAAARCAWTENCAAARAAARAR